jgi:hypothetical protein
MRQHPVGSRRLIVFLAVLGALLALTAAWRWTPLQDWLSPQRGDADFIGRFFLVGRPRVDCRRGGWVGERPGVVAWVVTVGAVAFPGWLAFVYMLGGTLMGSALGFVGGRVMSRGRGELEPISGSHLGQLSRQLAKRCTIAVAVLRLMPIAPFAVFNLAAGASHLGFRHFMVESLLRLASGLGGVTHF